MRYAETINHLAREKYQQPAVVTKARFVTTGIKKYVYCLSEELDVAEDSVRHKLGR